VTHTGFVAAMRLISDSGSALTWQIVLGAVVAWLLWRRLPKLALFVVITATGSSLLNTLVKTSVHRLRPVLSHPVAHEPGPSFPSGHAQAAVVGYAVLLLVFLRAPGRSPRSPRDPGPVPAALGDCSGACAVRGVRTRG
jgi:membrane-associated phospholipid phosphatase